MIQIRTNAQERINAIVISMGDIFNTQDMTKLAATAVLPVFKKRIHEEGKDASGSPIGTYSESYMKVRTGIYGNSARYKRGAKAGETKDSGTKTKGSSKGAKRKNYNRTGDTKVVLSLTREMENDEVILATAAGHAIGFTNQHNMDKAMWCEKTYKKPIMTKLTQEEENIAYAEIDKYLTEALKQIL